MKSFVMGQQTIKSLSKINYVIRFNSKGLTILDPSY